MIDISDNEMDGLLQNSAVKIFKNRSFFSQPGKVPDEIFFINRGTLRVVVLDQKGTEHTIHFALENQFIADYSGFLQRQPSLYFLQAVGEVEAVVLPRTAI